MILGGLLFANSQPRSFLAISDCGSSCYRLSDLVGLLTSAAIQRPTAFVPNVVRETSRCVAISHPFPESRYHFVIFPKKDIKDITDVSVDDQPYVMDCIAVIRALVLEHSLHDYRVHTNGPGLQDIRYLHFHLVSQ